MSEPESQAFLLKALTLASLLAPGQRRPKPRRHVEMINTRPLTKGCVCRASRNFKGILWYSYYKYACP